MRTAWVTKLGEWRAEQLVFLDESGVNMRCGDRIHGWSKKGAKISCKISAQKGKNFSILPAMNIDGYLACCVYQGAVNGDIFEAFGEREFYLFDSRILAPIQS